MARIATVIDFLFLKLNSDITTKVYQINYKSKNFY
jgi:hypothetical protein